MTRRAPDDEGEGAGAAQAPVLEKVSLADFKPLPEGAAQYPLEYIENNAAIKLKEDGATIHIGIVDPANTLLLDSLRYFHRKHLVFYRVESSELTGYLGERLSGREARNGAAGPGGAAAADQEKLSLDRLANDAPIVNLVNSLFIEAIRRQASDIHLECQADALVVRYRLDGYLHTVNRLERESFPAVSTRIKIMANLNIMERRLPQDGRISVHLGGDMVDLRVSVVPTASGSAGGESIVLRLFNKKSTLMSLDQLGLAEAGRQRLGAAARQPNGLILVTGPTGSGKTTTLSALLQEVRSETQKIITIEDPVEYLIEGVNQIQTNEKIGLTFDSLLRRVLRQDPDVIMVGEIRDTATAELAVRAALTGHLVLSTLHTRDAVSSVTRLKNMGVEPYLIAAVLRCAVAQRLVRRVCQECRREVPASAAERELLARRGLAAGPLFRGAGCRACNGTGYRGRIGLFEQFEADAQVEEMIVAGRREAELTGYLAARGMRPMIEDGLQKALQGLTTVVEVERSVSSA